MMETFVALLTAHVVADFIGQTQWMVSNKTRWTGLAAHGVWVAGAIIVIFGGIPWVILALVIPTHLILDYGKARGAFSRWGDFPAFMIDQAAHIAIITIAAIFVPAAYGQGVWFNPPAFWPDAWTMPQGSHQTASTIMAAISGFIIATRAGKFAISLLMERFLVAISLHSPQIDAAPPLERKYLPGESRTDDVTGPAGTTGESGDGGLAGAGALIGQLERGLTFVLVLAGQFGAIGFLIAAKSVLRFQYAKDRSQSEYVIIGTLASFAWAISAALATLWMIDHL